MKLIASTLCTSAYSLIKGSISTSGNKTMNCWLARTQGYNHKCMRDDIFNYSTNFKGYRANHLSVEPEADGLSPTVKTEQVSML
jgi:hypothetical protein